MKRRTTRRKSKGVNYGYTKHRGTSYKVLAQGQADDLIGDTGKIRTWKSRIDGSISTEVYNEQSGRWELQE